MGAEKTEHRLGFALPILMYVGIFALCCCILVCVFAGAKTMGRQAELKNNAVQLCRNAAEVYRAEGNIEAVQKVLAEGGPLCFDRNLKSCDRDDADLCLELTEKLEDSARGTMKTLELSALDGAGKVVYSLQVKVYVPKGQG